MPTLLLIRPGALGDALLTLPALRALRAAYGEVHVAGTPASWRFLAVPARGGVRVHDAGGSAWLGLYGGTWGESARGVLRDVSDAAVFLPPDGGAAERALRAAGVARVLMADPPRAGATGAPHAARRLLDPLAPLITHEAFARACAEIARTEHTVGTEGTGENEVCVRAKHDALPDKPAVALGGTVVPDKPARCDGATARRAVARIKSEDCAPIPPLDQDALLTPTAEETAAAFERFGWDAPPAGGFLALHPGSGGRAKCWPADRFARLGAVASRALGCLPLVFFGPADDQARAAFEAAWPSQAPKALAEHLPLREVLALLARARAYVGNDSGLTHLAARACPTLALFGPTDPAHWRPLGRRVRVLRAERPEMESLAEGDVRAALLALAD